MRARRDFASAKLQIVGEIVNAIDEQRERERRARGERRPARTPLERLMAREQKGAQIDG